MQALGQDIASLTLLRNQPAGNQRGQNDGGDHDERACRGGKGSRIGAVLGRGRHRQHHEGDDGNQRRPPQSTDHQHGLQPHGRRQLALHAQRQQRILFLGGGSAGLCIGGEQPRDPDREQDHAHHKVRLRPADTRRQNQAERAARQRSKPKAHLRHGGQQIERSVFIGNIDTPGVDDDVLRGRGKCTDGREQREPAKLSARIERGQRHQDHAQQHLRQHDPLLALAQLAHHRHIHPIQQRRPQELEGVSKPDQRKHAHRFKIDACLTEPGIKRSQEQRERQATGKAEHRHEPRLAIAERHQGTAPAPPGRRLGDGLLGHAGESPGETQQKYGIGAGCRVGKAG